MNYSKLILLCRLLFLPDILPVYSTNLTSWKTRLKLRFCATISLILLALAIFVWPSVLVAADCNQQYWQEIRLTEVNLQQLRPLLLDSCRYRNSSLPQNFCQKLANNPSSLMQLLPRYFQPCKSPQPALLTGYYLPEIEISFSKSDQFKWPIYQPPPARLRNLTRRQIEQQHKLAGFNLELAYTDNLIALFMAMVQGSTYAVDQQQHRYLLSFAATNEHNYTSLGKLLIARGVFTKEQLTAPKLVAYLQQLPLEQAQEIMWQNSRYIYFSIGEVKAITGGAGSKLQPNYSLAADLAHHRYGDLIYLSGQIAPDYRQQLMLVQDTGAAIKGRHRFDLFTGSGAAAYQLAGKLNQRLDYYSFMIKD